MRVLRNLWKDDAGFVFSAELVLVATILVLGLLVGMTAVRDAVVSELSDVAGAIQDLNQSYEFYGVVGHSGETAGSDFVDGLDHCDDADDPSGDIDNCITIDSSTIDDEA
jgi:hypothetical protein